MSQGAEGHSRRLRILLIAYEFPPSSSPQSLRWAYLSNRLAALGHEVHVMAPDLVGVGVGLPDPGPQVQMHRVHPGPMRALLGRLAGRRPLTQGGGEAPASAQHNDPFAGLGPGEPPRLNWKGALLERLQTAVSWLLFPDLRGEWMLPARRALPLLLGRIRPDVVITSHEPATTLLLGLKARRRGCRWIADLGDPVLAAYTPRRWRRRALTLERQVLREADHVLVTTVETAALLSERHPGGTRITAVPQGFDEHVPAGGARPAPAREAALELLYAGSFYDFRDPRPLVEGVLQVPGVRLNVASGKVPDWMVRLADRHPAQLRLLGRVPHRRLLALQRQADVLVNIANADPAQIPGKVFEYFGACRPVLHLQVQDGDAVGRLVSGMSRGWACRAVPEAVAGQVRRLRDRADGGRLDDGLDLGTGPVGQWSWTAIAEKVHSVLVSVSGRSSPGDGGNRHRW